MQVRANTISFFPVYVHRLSRLASDSTAVGTVCPWIAAFGRGRVGLTVARRNVIFDASLQPGTGSGVGGKGLWAACAAPPQTQTAGGRGKIATVVSGGACKATASGMPPGPARVRASLYVHARV